MDDGLEQGRYKTGEHTHTEDFFCCYEIHLVWAGNSEKCRVQVRVMVGKHQKGTGDVLQLLPCKVKNRTNNGPSEQANNLIRSGIKSIAGHMCRHVMHLSLRYSRRLPEIPSRWRNREICRAWRQPYPTSHDSTCSRG